MYKVATYFVPYKWPYFYLTFVFRFKRLKHQQIQQSRCMVNKHAILLSLLLIVLLGKSLYCISYVKGAKVQLTT